ncbi:MAG TPA: hypothetical protein VF074_00270 [Pyrinomonadaceae bacterium]
MTTRILLVLLVISLFSSIGERVSAQECKPPEITANARNFNIFSPEQEMVLGDLTYEQLLGELRFVKDEKLLAHLNAIGARLIRHLPQTFFLKPAKVQLK